MTADKKNRQIKVAIVVSPTEVVINVGSENGVKRGERYLVYSLGPEVKDPDTGELLGALEIVKGTGTVVHVQPKIATIRSERIVEKSSSPDYATAISLRHLSLSQILGSPSIEKTREMQTTPFDNAVVGDLVKRVGSISVSS